VIDGTHGLVIYGDGALMQRGRHNAAICWCGSASKPIFQVKGGTGSPSNPNFYIAFRDLTISGSHTHVPADAPPVPQLALAGIHLGNLAGEDDNTLCRRCIIENVHISNCRFGIWSGNPEGKNTDHASVLITGCTICNNAQAGIRWGTGNAIAHVISCDIGGNGWAGGAFPADAYSDGVGANVHVHSGYMDIVSYTSAGRPTTADIYQSSGRVSIVNAWSDVFGYFFYQAGASQNQGGYHNGQITGVRHYCDGMTVENTPHSMRLLAPGMFVSSCLVYGNIEVESGLGGRPVFAGLNFIRADATFVGSGVNIQRSLAVLGHCDNNAQILLGGADEGVPLEHRGSDPPRILSLGTNPCLCQVLDASKSGSGLSFHVRTDDADEPHLLILNGYQTDAGVRPLQADKMVWLVQLGGINGCRISGADPSGSSAEVPLSAFVEFGGFRTGVGREGRGEVTFQPPARTQPPRAQPDDYWRGSLYFDTSRNKLRINVGGSNWVDLH
jgi:hypothetical protein